MSAGYAYIWEYTIHPAFERAFVDAYAPEGEWVQLFRQHEGYIRTEFFRDLDNPDRFVTIDYWTSREAWQAFRDSADAAFRELDERCARYTLKERELGTFAPDPGR